MPKTESWSWSNWMTLAVQPAHQDVDDLARAELLPTLPVEAHHRGEDLLRGDRAVPGLRRREARVAVAAVSRLRLLPEVHEQLGPAALSRLAQRQHRVEVGPRPAPERLVALPHVDQLPLLDDVLQPVRHPGRGSEPVTPGAARLLVVALDGLREIEMRDEPDVGLVDAHAERDGRADDQALLAQEAGLVRRAGARVETRVVRDSLDAVPAEELGRRLHRLAREAVHDARVALVLLLEEGEELLLRVGLRHDPVLDVGPVEARHEVLRVRHAQALGDLLVRGVRRRRRERDARHVRPAPAEDGQGQVVRAEVVPPLRHTVRLVDREDGDPAAGEQIERGVEAEPLRCQIDDIQLTREELGLDGATLVEVLRRVHEPGADAERAQRVHLVLHESDEGRDHDACAGPDQGRDLIAQGLSAAGRHQDDGVPAVHDMVDDRFLLAAERVISEDAVQRLQRAAAHRRRHAGLRHLAHATDPIHRPVPVRPYFVVRPLLPR